MAGRARCAICQTPVDDHGGWLHEAKERKRMKPTVGRIVHYRSYGTPGGEYAPECRAAIVTQVFWDRTEDETSIEELVSLAVMNPEGMFFNQGVRQGESPQRGGTWHWPEREEG